MDDKNLWNEGDIIWSDNPYKWSEIAIVAKVAGGASYQEEYDKLSKEEKKKFIEVVVKVKSNLEYASPHIYNEKKEVQDGLEVSVEDIKLVIKEVLGVNLEIDNIHV